MALGVSRTDGTGSTANTEAVLNDFIASNNGIKPALYSVWSQWGHRGGEKGCKPGKGSCRFPRQTLEMLDDKGIMGVVWWEPVDPGNQLNAKYARHKATFKFHKNDSYIQTWAQEAKAFGQERNTKVILRLAHEPNGTWFPWTVGYFDNTPRTFKKFWRYVWRIFRDEGALPYVDFLWSVTKKDCKGCNPFNKVYPGNKYVKYVGVTAFNWGKQKSWKPMVKVLRRPMKQLWQITHKPVIISELASHFRPLSKSKANWIKYGYNKTYRKWGRIKAIMYLDTRQPKQIWGHPDWRLVKPNDGSAVDAYAAISAKPKFQGSLQ